MRNVLHIEVPRAFTMGIREFDVRTFMNLEENGVAYTQVDLNLFFWEYMFCTYAPQFSDDVHEIFYKATQDTSVYINAVAAFEEINSHLQTEMLLLNTSGLHTSNQEITDSSERIQLFLQSNAETFFNRLNDEADKIVGFGNYDVISVGLTGRNSALCAFALAKYLKKKYPKTIVGIGKHHYENFSLLFTLDRIKQTKSLFNSFDFISLYEEKSGDTFLGILSGDESLYRNCAWLSGTEVLVRHPKEIVVQCSQLTDAAEISLEKYVNSLHVRARNLHYNMQLIGNQCYYSKCTFCAQINKHMNSRVYREVEALQLSLSIIKKLVAIGVRYFSFTDEALRPRDLLILSDRIQEDSLDIRFNIRMIANTKVNSDLIGKLYNAGCREVLFGLETIDEETAAAMGKVSSKDEESVVNEMVFNFTAAGINIILSMIYGFPGFGVQKDNELIAYAEKMMRYNPRVLFIFNRFELFGGTRLQRNPKEYGVSHISGLAPDNDLGNTYHFEPRELSMRNETAFRILNLHPCKSPVDIITDIKRNQMFSGFQHLRYTSFGFTYMQEHNSDLYAQLTRAYEEV